MIFSSLAVALVSMVLASAAPRDAARPRIVVLGDSLASGRGIGADHAFPAVLQEKLDDEGLEFEVVNGAISGDTSSRALRRVEAPLHGGGRGVLGRPRAHDGRRPRPPPA